MDGKDADERARLLAEMRAYGHALPFKQPASRTRRNTFDAATGEWLRSRTFKTILAVTCLLACLIFCLPIIATVLGGVAIIDALNHALVEMGGLP